MQHKPNTSIILQAPLDRFSNTRISQLNLLKLTKLNLPDFDLSQHWIHVEQALVMNEHCTDVITWRTICHTCDDIIYAASFGTEQRQSPTKCSNYILK